uniref:Uncharacterized protein n=1 Tax=Trichobilharzia regenti TaxID=157069 RepID=A0AA85K4K6_TRIRE|nr:unnamed protein product [Trichobilharzia regenti]
MTSRQICLSLPESYQINSLKIIYLTCATVITTTFIVECILIHLVVQPYLHESAFTHTNCSFVHAHITKNDVKCENKCSKDRSKFPCLQVTVQYRSGRKNHTVTLYDNIATYNHYKVLKLHKSSISYSQSQNMLTTVRRQLFAIKTVVVLNNHNLSKSKITQLVSQLYKSRISEVQN